MEERVALFSGRFDRPHPGHLLTIMRLGQEFDCVVVVVLDYPEQKYPAEYRAGVLRECLRYARGRYYVKINKDHFAKITKDAASIVVDGFPFGGYVYCSGNLECLNHMRDLGFYTQYTLRSFDYEASKESV